LLASMCYLNGYVNGLLTLRATLERDDLSSNRHPAPALCLSMIFLGKPVATQPVVARGHAFPDHALDRLIAFGCAGVVGVNAPAVDDDAAGYRDAVGLRAQGLAVRGCELQGPDAGRPVLSVEVAMRRRYLNLGRIGRGGEHRIKLFAEHLLDVGRRVGWGRVALLGPHEFRHRRTAIGNPASRKRKRG